MPSTPRHHGLSAGHFRRIGTRGWGDGANSYSWSGVWYDDHIYIGSNRHLLVSLKHRVNIPMPAVCWPVPMLDADHPKLDLRSEIWRYSPKKDSWERVYRAPMVPGIEGRLAPQAYGFRNMSVFRGKSD